MALIKRIFYLFTILIFFVQCNNTNKYEVKKGMVGSINKNTTIADLSKIFKEDSIVSNKTYLDTINSKKMFSLNDDEFDIYSKSGKKLLEITATTQNDSLSKIKSVGIYDPNYVTDKGISLKSTFKDINENYLVNNVETTLTSATLFIDELNATISIDKKELGISKFSTEEILLNQIPDMAKIKYFTIWFN
ncbi:MAG: hypothetical protein R3342_11980 [Lutibacter sp.]|uniref:hypothetical protein n=1 Tax=Lutibacter sp. TaxID=1925666 RepID=UPI00299EEA46|nr:hypothetical protein [Lutibacter sp.]MDX1830253.1 hypothetical protein [Lutibacter sp.]